MLETVLRFKNAILRIEYLKKLGFELGIKEDALLEEAKRIKQPQALRSTSQELPVTKRALSVNPTEKLLMSLAIEENSLISRIRDNFDPQDFRDERISRIVSVMFKLMEQGKEVKPHLLANHLDEEIGHLICSSELLPEGLSLEHKERMVDDCLRRLKAEKKKYRREKLHQEIENAQHSGDEDRLNRLMEQFHALIKEE
jgi:hypothetical protein